MLSYTEEEEEEEEEKEEKPFQNLEIWKSHLFALAEGEIERDKSLIEVI